MRARWFGAHRVKVPEIAVEGEDVELPDDRHAALGGERYEVFVVADVQDVEPLRDAHLRGVPVLVRARSAEEVVSALARPEVACAVVPPSERELRALDLTQLTYE